ncbi:protein PLASTID REDOX INSENSITIVE 2, chloroplastic [Telopea speciosissima]|uniref:protein PLASTID REDOX INSENSITIVE 2, chloroplastic n=1 Tax=Telopea speciosissima TaxID=54955 RepID=UPI001CC551F6|nr:protein PLASTID REDOX INSENSITIVE 2, chloroplastic [Telopea speciosissima]
MAGSKALALSVAPLTLSEYSHSFPSSSSSSLLSLSSLYNSSSASGFGGTAPFICRSFTNVFGHSSSVPLLRKNIAAPPPSLPFSFSSKKQICRAAEYKFPDPIPEFAESETERFRTHLHKKLSKRSIYGDSVQEVVEICTEIFNTFLHTEYGGPGTLLVIPFIDMADTLNERGLPGAPQAARAAVVWAQEHVDKDWNEWTGGDANQ